VNLSDWVPDVALSHLLANEDRVFDGVGRGSATLSFTVEGTRKDGSPFSVSRSDVFADDFDLTWATAWDLYDTLWTLQANRSEHIAIDTVVTDSDLTRDYEVSSIEEIRVKRNGTWVPLGRRLRLVAGQVATFQVALLSTGGDVSSVKVALPIRAKDAGRGGWLEIVGGNSSGTSYGGRNTPLDKLITRIETAPHNDDVIASMRLWGERRNERTVKLDERTPTGTPVDGGMGAEVLIVG